MKNPYFACVILICLTLVGGCNSQTTTVNPAAPEEIPAPVIGN